MKKYLLSLLFVSSLTAVAQNEKEKKIIVDSYNKNEVQELQRMAKQKAVEQKQLISDFRKNNPNLFESQEYSLQRIYNGEPIFYKSFNAGSALTLRANTLYTGGGQGLSLSGTGMTAGVWDSGRVRETHQEFGNRVSIMDGSTVFGSHSTHVTGTIAAQGTNAALKGIAFGANAKTYNWDDDYNEMVTFGAVGDLVSNHSYGYAVNSSFPSWRYGSYDASSIEVDQVSVTYPFYQVVVAAGNDRNDTSLPQVLNTGGYDLLTGMSVSKNSLIVAAVEEVPSYVDESSVIMSNFSNFGPTDDGRIKPDIAAKGVGVISTSQMNNFATSILSGTSMAAPSITGLVLLLQKHYNNLNPSTFMKAAMVRGLICHSAREAGINPGPDYEFGWGLADGQEAARIITNRNTSSVLELNTLANNQTFTKNITITSQQDLEFSICWTDRVGVANAAGDENNRSPRLVNNLDIKVKKGTDVYYPYKLNPDLPGDPATIDSDNDVDNIEKVVINDAEPGVYTIEVKHKGTLVGGNQEFALIGNGSAGLTLSNNDFIYDNTIFVYPNPASNVLNFDVNGTLEINNIKITDISGKQVLTKVEGFTSNTLDISQLASGVYFATFTSGNNSVVKKFIKN
jgi:serine protease AprX